MASVFISPHDDDHALFGAFTCLREKPILVVVFDSYVQASRGLGVTAGDRMDETWKAAERLECSGIVRLGFRDDDPAVTPARVRSRAGEALAGLKGKAIYAPAYEQDGHHQHNLVAAAFAGNTERQYMTYTKHGKSHGRDQVFISDGSWIWKKLLALACYKSQMAIDPRMGCWPHFLRSQEEYYL